ncbi:hypothetical protein [Iningainema tapete]|uniref:Uncharacterized protein n=1 Tax=Iningainema tapete BLCC-T55 TaxID=2748662 RepID=A0A8J6XB82_9CYAN|nr:hypothetical protein [Iningainema tapete]MBD2771414.1 hypothetical protein [Iningainema tapete BLCC-T55]
MYDRHRKRVISLAVLASEEKNWQPSSFGYELGGCCLSARVSRRKTVEVLATRFGEVPELIVDAINRIDEPSVLKNLLRRACVIGSFAEFQQVLNQMASEI